MALRFIPLSVLVATCGSGLPRPSYTEQPTSALIEVDYPPPPARVAFVPPQPRSDAVWVNGQWQWQGRRWAWKAGGWFLPPRGAAYARPVVVRRSDGKLFFAAGTWRRPGGEEVMPPPEPQQAAPSTAGAVVNPEGETEPTAADIHRDAGRDAEID